MILPFGERTAQIDPTAVVFESAWVIGSVRLGPRSSVWFGSVVRADVDDVEIGTRSNIQDRCVVHVTTKRFSTRIGDDVTVGHSVTLHGCEIGNRVLVGRQQRFHLFARPDVERAFLAFGVRIDRRVVTAFG